MNRLWIGCFRLISLAGTLVWLCGFPQVVTSQTGGYSAQVAVEPSVIQFSQQALSNYVQNVVNDKNFTKFGFRSLDEAKRARLGEPYRVAIIGLRQLKDYKPGGGAKMLLTDAHTVLFPVLVDGQVRTKLEVVQKAGRLVPGEFGGTRTVQIVEEVASALPKLLETRHVTTAAKPILVKVPALFAQFLYVETPSGEFLIPAMIQPQRFELQNSVLYTSDAVLTKLAEAAKQVDENKVM